MNGRELPIIQFEDRPGILDLGWGHPCPSLLPVAEWQKATQATMEQFGWQVLTYGYATGPGPLIEWLSGHVSKAENAVIDPSQFFITAGASHALELISAVLAEPQDVVLVDSPTYHFALRILRDHGLEIVKAPTDDDGIDPAALDELLASLLSRGRRVPMLYIVPTFGNPTGRSLPSHRRCELVQMARRTGLTVVEDDTYRELVYQGTVPTSLWRLADGEGVVRIGSFSKTVAPGLRLGWINAAPGIVRRLASLGYVDSGGGINHATALTMATFGTSGTYGQHVAHVRGEYRLRRDTLVGALRNSLPDLHVPSPAGGWFVWLPLPPGMTASVLLRKAESLGVSFVPGTLFYADAQGGYNHVRLSFSLLTPPQLIMAAERLTEAIQAVS
jgi:2-aminoadipate transaminase